MVTIPEGDPGCSNPVAAQQAAAAAGSGTEPETLPSGGSSASDATMGMDPVTVTQRQHFAHKNHRQLSDTYTVVRTLGEGAQGKVKLAVDKSTGKEVALKLVDRKSKHMHCVLVEADLLHHLPHHQNVVTLVESFLTETHFVLVLEALSCDVFSLLESGHLLTHHDVHRLMRMLLAGLDHCHKNGVAHRDIKPENILLDSLDPLQAKAKLCDFGLGSPLNRKAATLCGSEAYTAPEVLVSGGYDATKADVWSAGIALYNLSTTYSPWAHAIRTDPVFDRYVRVRPDFWEWSRRHSPDVITPDFISLFDGMCHLDPTKRLTAGQALAHPYFPPE